MAIATLPYAESMAGIAEGLVRSTSAPSDTERGTVRITCSEVVGAEVLADLRRAHPNRTKRTSKTMRSPARWPTSHEGTPSSHPDAPRQSTPTHKLVVFGNHKPRIRCVDDAMKRRLRLVPFTVSFEGRQDKTLSTALLSEASGVLRRLVDGCLAWQREGWPDASAVREATGQYFRDKDVLGQF